MRLTEGLQSVGWRCVLAGMAIGTLYSSVAASADFNGETIVFGGDAAYPPFEWVDQGTARGFDIDLAKALVEAGDAQAEFRLGDWPDTIRALESGEVDAVAMFVSEQREQRFTFTPPFHFVNHRIYARRDAENVSSIGALDQRRVAVEELSYAHQQLQDESIEPTLVLTDNTVEALEAVADGRADFALLAAPTANFLIEDRGLPLRSVGPPLWSRGYAFAVRKDRPELAQWLTEQFYVVLRSNTYHDLFQRWENELAPAEESLLSRVLSFALIPSTIIGLLGLAWAFRLRRTVIGHAKHLLDESKRRLDAESRADWRTDHDVYTELPRLHHFVKQVDALLNGIEPSDTRRKQIVALRPADLDRIIRTLGHESGIAAMCDFVNRLHSFEFEAYGQTGRDVFLIFGDKQYIDSKLRAVLAPDETGIIEAVPLPRLFAGAAIWPEHGRTVTELIRRAETALAVAADRREGWCEYTPAMDPDASALELIATFRQTNGANLYPVFQPQVDLSTGALIGAEALVRWDAPGFGNVPPDRFIPLLEDAGLVKHVTRFMLGEAVRVGAELRQSGISCPISVNVSVADLLTDKTRKGIFKALNAQSGMPGDLKLELTETSVAEQPETIRWVITRLRDSGIATSIDDFGTGYSSLSYLSDFPIQEVKIDRSFVSGMSTRPQDRSIVRSTIAMAHELGLLVVAEGVETQETVELLRSDNCDRAQGYFFARPMPETDFLNFARSNSADTKAQTTAFPDA